MSNRSHRNSGHIGMNALKKKGVEHSSLTGIQEASNEQTVHLSWVGDCLASLSQIPDSSIQLIVCDPPYNINVADWDEIENYVDWAALWLQEVERVLCPTGYLVLFGGLQYQGEVSSGDLLSLVSWMRQNSSLSRRMSFRS